MPTRYRRNEKESHIKTPSLFFFHAAGILIINPRASTWTQDKRSIVFSGTSRTSLYFQRDPEGILFSS